METGGVFMLMVCSVLGFLMGMIYFSGLWQTVRHLSETPHPLRLLLFSFAGRLALAVAGFYLMMDGAWERLAAAMAGFLVARALLVSKLGKVAKPPKQGVTIWK